MFKTDKKYLGQTINAKKDDDNIVIVGGKKVRVKKNLEPNGVYSFSEKSGGMTLAHHSTEWGMSAEEHEKFSAHSQDLVKRLFGDIIK